VIASEATPLPLAIGLAGPTASGKTAAALALARELPLEIISVDSALVYRGMDIGTAKPSAAERAAVPHHLIDVIDPRDAFSAAQFVDQATRLIADVRTRGRLPLLVGGTMLYFKALREGLHALPAADPTLRAAIEQRAAERGWPALHAELAQVDPATAARLAPGDAQRIQRALEVWHSSGRTLSSWQAAALTRPGMALPLVSLEPQSRTWLHERIAQRFDAMLAAGLLDEVRALRARGDLTPALPSMRCVGYRQAWAVLDAAAPGTTDDQLRAALRGPGIAATRQLAKRQLTWLRSITARRVVAADAEDALPQALAALRAAAATVALPGPTRLPEVR
jgi:tRNA dimethylallyltransferase